MAGNTTSKTKNPRTRRRFKLEKKKGVWQIGENTWKFAEKEVKTEFEKALDEWEATQPIRVALARVNIPLP